MAKIKFIFEDDNVIIKTKKSFLGEAVAGAIDDLIEEKNMNPTAAYGVVVGYLARDAEVSEKEVDDEIVVTLKNKKSCFLEAIDNLRSDFSLENDEDDDEYEDDEEDEYNDEY